MAFTSWYDIYRDRMNDHYRKHVAKKYAPFIEELQTAKQAIRYYELGCGAGNITRVLRGRWSNKPRHHTLVDSCPKMLGLAIENNPDPACTFVCADVTAIDIWNADVVHSHGLLEHFDDATIRVIVTRCAAMAPLQLHYVPGARYVTPSRGDERLLTPEQWLGILDDVGVKASVSTFNDEHDLIIRIES